MDVPDETKHDGIIELARRGDAEHLRVLVTQLAELGAPTSDGCRDTRIVALEHATLNGHVEAVQVLVECSRPSDRVPLASAALFCAHDAAVFDKLIALGADVNLPGDDGWPPLHSAVARAMDQHVAGGMALDLSLPLKLIALGADPERRTSDGDTAYDAALKYGPAAVSIVEELRQAADVYRR